MAEQTVNTKKISGWLDFIQGFLEYAVDCGKEAFPSFWGERSRPWHEFLFTLKRDFGDRFPVLKLMEDFDWDGSYPKVRGWNEIRFGLEYVCGHREINGRVYSYLRSRRGTNPLVIHYPELAEEALDLASKIPGFFEN